MGRYLTERMFIVLTQIIMLLHLFATSSSGASHNTNETGVFISKGGRYQPYDPNLCSKVFNGKTCCSASQIHSVSSSLKNLATYGEAAEDCLGMFELLQCSTCHHNFKIRSGSLRVCASFCDRVFEACKDAYFSTNARDQVIVPCGERGSIICGKASKFESNGTSFCNALGFNVQRADDSLEQPCYQGKAVVESLIKTEKNLSRLSDLKKLVREMTLVQEISWIVTSFVIGAMLFQRWSHEKQTRAMIAREARRLRRYNMNGIAHVHAH